MGRLFGTDGVRGLANVELTASLALKLGQSAGYVLTRSSKSSPARAIVGRDTRVSGDFLAAAVCSGLASAGVDVVDIGVLPTPGIAHLTRDLGIDVGVVISASHNAMPDNGIKFFSRTGFKLDDALEDEIEQGLDASNWTPPTGRDVGRITVDFEFGQKNYCDHLVNAIGKNALSGLRIALDTANGAASEIAPEVFAAVGAEVLVINNAPDGYNINENCGSTHPEGLQELVKRERVDFGFAFDGDADRCIGVDENGELLDGDKIIAALAMSMQRAGILRGQTVALTVMSNLGIRNALTKAGISIETTGVGDRYVLERMLQQNLILGGEQSGHVINLEHSTTGDGVLSALLFANTFQAERKRLSNRITMSQMVGDLQKYPQVLMNVGGVNQKNLDADDELQHFAKELENELGDDGRILLRASGTEPLVRVMVEASSQEVAQNAANQLVEKVRQRLML